MVAPDDAAIISRKKQWTVRDNVLFEAGVFMGALGPKRTFLLWPANAQARLRLPSDLLGLATVSYLWRKPLTQSRVAVIRRAIRDQGRALKSSYNELATLTEQLDEHEILFTDDTTASIKQILQPVAARRKRLWYPGTPVELLLNGISQGYDDGVVDQVFWWLIIYGVVTFDNIDVWIEGERENGTGRTRLNMRYSPTVGVVLLNQMRAECHPHKTKR